ncbi:hypothetical protein F3Y22_tig00110656pilonHSYRG00056 [Hibiscus syriacus]|uniref:Uncharacterized protein n=1 Tax=Hibiscus syriacus TaxID=106335 RepID=A0A6A2ZXR8_HIBSY|nr:hypothetical protein F3Y22_tig00110656pilonHSYRG00056 [Hibiscus syriacus]
MRKSFKDSLKALESDIQFANTLASDYPREYDGPCLQIRLSYSSAAHFSFSLSSGLIVILPVPWDCSEFLYTRHTPMVKPPCLSMKGKLA